MILLDQPLSRLNRRHVKHPPKPNPATVHHAITPHAAGIPIATIIASIGSLTTAGAFIAAFIVLWMQLQNQRQAHQDRHRDHASRIAFWITLESAQPEHDPVCNPDAPCINMKIHLRNTSDRPAMAGLALAGVRRDVWQDTDTADGTTSTSKIANGRQ
jgi:hypothetical protein